LQISISLLQAQKIPQDRMQIQEAAWESWIEEHYVALKCVDVDSGILDPAL
jgi:hypothetical protein